MSFAANYWRADYMLLVHGLGYGDIIQLIARLLLGVFFVLARFRFFYDPTPPDGGRSWMNPWRHAHLAAKMEHCGFKTRPLFFAWFAAVVEVSAGFGVLFGFLAPLSAIGLLVITSIGTRCTARDKILKQQPIDTIQCCEDYLWLPEPLYIGLALIVILGGAGPYSLDALLWG
jgi:uncharacterized membrane protein YphA (DoxX/SURF4 family)